MYVSKEITYKFKKNTSLQVIINNTYSSVQCGKFTVLGLLDYLHGNYISKPMYLVQFLNTKTIMAVHRRSVITGSIKDPYAPSIFNIGFLGVGKNKATIDKKMTLFYRVWNGMLSRCYCPAYLKCFPTYKDCTVDPRWHNFQNFCEDIQELEGYAKWKADSLLKGKAKYELDKDIKVKGNKVYSKDTCMFVTSIQNTRESTQRRGSKGPWKKAINIKSGQIIYFLSNRLFSQKYNVSYKGIRRVLQKEYKQSSGWVYTYEPPSQGGFTCV